MEFPVLLEMQHFTADTCISMVRKHSKSRVKYTFILFLPPPENFPHIPSSNNCCS